MVEKGIRGGICHAIYWYVKANNNYKKDYDIKNLGIVLVLIYANVSGNVSGVTFRRILMC